MTQSARKKWFKSCSTLGWDGAHDPMSLNSQDECWLTWSLRVCPDQVSQALKFGDFLMDKHPNPILYAARFAPNYLSLLREDMPEATMEAMVWLLDNLTYEYNPSIKYIASVLQKMRPEFKDADLVEKEKMVVHFLHGGIDPSSRSAVAPLLFYAIRCGLPPVMLEHFLTNPNHLHLKCWDGKTVLHAADQHPKTIAYLLDKGANPLQTDNQGRTPLMEAVSGKNKESVKMLIGVSDVWAQDSSGNSALSWARSKDQNWHDEILAQASSQDLKQHTAGRATLKNSKTSPRKI